MNKQTNFFDFDLDSNVLDKLNENKTNLINKKRNFSWNYENILKKENEFIEEKTKKNRKNLKNFEEENILIKESKKNKEDSFEESDEEKNYINLDEETNKINMIDKFENNLYAKGFSFTNFNISKLIIKGLSEMEFYTPTKVQEKVIPFALNNHDLLVNAETGSGKTACYLIPIIQKIILNKNKKEKIQSLILVPTRELALQINSMLKALSKFVDINYIFLVGGISVENNINDLIKNIPDIIIATPGRLIDMLYNYKNINLINVTILVLDEADKLLELGFRDLIDEICNYIKSNKKYNNLQTMLFSATLNPKIINLGEDILINPIKIKINKSIILTNLKQSILRLKFTDLKNNNFEKRMSYLINLIKQYKLNRSIIFFNTKSECHRCYLIFKNYNISSCEINSNINQTERIKNLDDFQKGKKKFLIATDIAGRGIDIEKVENVINFQMPLIGERYIHRIGRTARYKSQGNSILFVSSKEEEFINELKNKEIDIKKIKFSSNKISNMQTVVRSILSEHSELISAAEKAISSYLKSINMFSNKKIYNIKNIDLNKLALSYGLVSSPELIFKNMNDENDDNEENDNENKDKDINNEKIQKKKVNYKN